MSRTETARGIAAAVRAGERSAASVVDGFLARIAATEPSVRG